MTPRDKYIHRGYPMKTPKVDFREVQSYPLMASNIPTMQGHRCTDCTDILHHITDSMHEAVI